MQTRGRAREQGQGGALQRLLQQEGAKCRQAGQEDPSKFKWEPGERGVDLNLSREPVRLRHLCFPHKASIHHIKQILIYFIDHFNVNH